MPSKSTDKVAPETVAVVTSGDKQTLVAQGDTIVVPKRSEDVGATVTVSDLLAGKKVTAEVIEHFRLPKVSGRLFRNKVRGSRYPHGHRQHATRLTIKEIK